MVKCNGYIFGLILFIYLGSGNADEQPSTEKFPYLASIQAPGFRGRNHVCNGVIINNNWALTTSSCVLHFDDPHAFKIRVGGTDSFDGEDYTVDRKEFHPLYSVNNSDYNLALLRVQSPVIFNDRTKSIDIVSDTPPFRAEQTGVLAGWELSNENRYQQVTLSSLEVVILENSECEADDRVNKLCVRIITPAAPGSMCSGAAGSPLVINGALVAISTNGVGCQLEKETRVLTPINAEIKEWITTVTTNNEII